MILIAEMTHPFNLSVRSAIFPQAWKDALVIPIPKSGDLHKVNNFGPISPLPLPGKILEKLVHVQLTACLEENSILEDVQHGFRKNHSTVHSVAQLTNYINVKKDIEVPTLATYINFRKAFDCVQHDTLINKLKCSSLPKQHSMWAPFGPQLGQVGPQLGPGWA